MAHVDFRVTISEGVVSKLMRIGAVTELFFPDDVLWTSLWMKLAETDADALRASAQRVCKSATLLDAALGQDTRTFNCLGLVAFEMTGLAFRLKVMREHDNARYVLIEGKYELLAANLAHSFFTAIGITAHEEAALAAVLYSAQQKGVLNPF